MQGWLWNKMTCGGAFFCHCLGTYALRNHWTLLKHCYQPKLIDCCNMKEKGSTFRSIQRICYMVDQLYGKELQEEGERKHLWIKSRICQLTKLLICLCSRSCKRKGKEISFVLIWESVNQQNYGLTALPGVVRDWSKEVPLDWFKNLSIKKIVHWLWCKELQEAGERKQLESSQDIVDPWNCWLTVLHGVLARHRRKKLLWIKLRTCQLTTSLIEWVARICKRLEIGNAFGLIQESVINKIVDCLCCEEL